MAKHKVNYQGGESRYSNAEIDYMIVEVPDPENEDEMIELYAEMENPTWDEETEAFTDECYTYDDLKAEIVSQARENGIDPETLVFYYDDDWA